MPLGTDSDAPGAGQKERKHLRQLVRHWKELREEIAGILDVEEDDGSNVHLAELRSERQKTVDDIDRIVGDNHNHYEFVQDLGFRTDLLTGTSGPGKGGGKGKDKGPGGGGGGDDRPRDNRPRNKHRHEAQVDRDLLPGKKGADYYFVKRNGKVRVVYHVPLDGKTIKMSWRMTDKDMEANGINAANVRNITRDQWRQLNNWGDASEIVRGKGGNKHPFKKVMRDLNEQYHGLSLIRNKEVMGVFLMGHLEGLSAEEIRSRLQRTKWYQKRTEWQRQWELDFTKATRQKTIDQRERDLTEWAIEQYGMENWRDHISGKEIRRWAENIASGKWGDPTEALKNQQLKIQHQAEKVEGTSAWVAKQQEEIAERDFMNRPEEAFVQLREDAISWLGYAGKPSQDFLMDWAEDIAFGRKDEKAWNEQLRTMKRGLYPFLDPDEQWMDAAAPYKGMGEELLGVGLSWDDPLLRSLGATDANGQPTGTRISMTDFERTLRHDQRFDTSKVANEEGYGILSMLDRMFNGVGA